MTDNVLGRICWREQIGDALYIETEPGREQQLMILCSDHTRQGKKGKQGWIAKCGYIAQQLPLEAQDLN